MFETNIANFVNKNQLKTTVSDATRVHSLAVSLREFADLDMKDALHGVKYGEVCHKILALPLQQQRQVVEALAKSLNAPAPEYPDPNAKKKRGRPFKGRGQLASVLYAPWADTMLVPSSKKSKDTIAGKRLSRYMREYMVASGQVHKRIGAKRPVSFRTFDSMMRVASLPDQEVIIRVLKAAKLDKETLAKWLKRVNVTLAPSISAGKMGSAVQVA